jgi:hypothetical protein
MVIRLSCAVNTSAKPSSGRYAPAANVDGRFAMPHHPKEPSCHAISIHVSIISGNEGSTPPAGMGLNADIRPLAHISSTMAGVSVSRPPANVSRWKSSMAARPTTGVSGI